METQSLPLQNVQKVRYNIGFIWLNFIKHTPFIRFIVFH